MSKGQNRFFANYRKESREK